MGKNPRKTLEQVLTRPSSPTQQPYMLVARAMEENAVLLMTVGQERSYRKRVRPPMWLVGVYGWQKAKLSRHKMLKSLLPGCLRSPPVYRRSLGFFVQGVVRY